MNLGPLHLVRPATLRTLRRRLAAAERERDRYAALLPASLPAAGVAGYLHPTAGARLAPPFLLGPDPDDARCRAAVARVVAAYRRARADFIPAAPGLWDLAADRHADFLADLDRGDETAVADRLRRVFQTPLIDGLGYVAGDLPGLIRARPHGHRFQVRLTDLLVALAEAVGAARVACAEQDPDGVLRALDRDPDELLPAVEAALGLDLSAPPVGGNYGFVVAGCRTAPDVLVHACTLHRLRELGAAPGDRLAEIGGGYGCLAFLAARAGFTDFTVYDLPWVNAVQGYVLIRSLPDQAVHLYGEPGAGGVAVLPGWCFAARADRSVDWVINTNSLPEMGAATALGYLREIARTARRGLYSVNQEAKAPVPPFGPQGCVAELAAAAGGLRRRSRCPAWMRAGYVEEVYEPAA